ncbi:uncharacterized protein LOC130671158 [Microplitis mediator]|uniref:uncharacterized protein LOC130671158 n=1 Tax=Microplitis mediator TaxID=375433 RepID=UPI002556D97E|nr:uncharacterized protein LOC130671158 [Microplitis mediator]
MNFFITILLCVFISIITEAAVISSTDVAGLKNKIIAVENDLSCYNDTFKSNYEIQLNEIKIKYIDNIHQIIDSVRKETQRIIFSDNDGYDAEECYERVNERLDDDSQNAINSLNECTDKKFIELTLIQYSIEGHIIISHEILTRFDSIVECKTDISVEMEPCDEQKLSAINYEVKNYQSTAEQLKRIGDAMTRDALTNTTACFDETIINLSADVQLSKHLAIICSSHI